MKSYLHSHNRGFTLLELSIGILIFSIVMGGMYSFISQAGKASSKSYSRQDLVTQANIVLKQMQEDFRMAASASISLNPTQAEVKIVQMVNNKPSKISYSWTKPNLDRKAEYDGKTTLHRFSKNLETFSVEKKPRPTTDENSGSNAADEQVVIRLGLTFPVAGSGKPLTHEQHAMATMRDVSSLKYDPHWRDVGNLKGAFSTYGNLLQSLSEDSQLLVEDVTQTIDTIVADTENAVNAAGDKVANLKNAKNQINSALGDIKQGKIDLDGALDDMENNIKSMPTDVFTRDSIKNVFASKDDALKRVQNAFCSMKTLNDMDISKLENAADPFKLDDSFRSFFKSKKEALENKVKMNNNQASLTTLLDDVNRKLGGEAD